MNARQRIERLARRSHNFGFLLVYQPLLVAYGAGAEMVVFTDPNAAFVKERQFVEVLTQELVARFGLRAGGRLVDRIRALSAAGALTAQVERDMHRVRDVGNVAVHPPFFDDVKEALTCLRPLLRDGRLVRANHQRRPRHPNVRPAHTPAGSAPGRGHPTRG
jgi:type I restriction enzyme, R subunit